MSKMRKTKIDVTRKNIMEGRCNDASRCAVASAFRDVVRTGVRVHVDGSSVLLSLPGGKLYDMSGDRVWSAELPSKVQEFVEEYDRCTSSRDFGRNWRKSRAQKAALRPIKFTFPIPTRFLPEEAV